MDFKVIKQNVTTKEAAEAYGIEVNKNGMAKCPFHDDHNPSMKVDENFYCFGCQEHGDVINFTSKLFDISLYEAGEKLAKDFGIQSSDAPAENSSPSPVKKPTLQQRYDRVLKFYLEVLTEYRDMLHEWEEAFAPSENETEHEVDPRYLKALQKKDRVEDLLDIVTNGTDDERTDMIIVCGEEIGRYVEELRGEHRTGEITEIGGGDQ